jgi:putative flippase GtrA
MKTLKVVYVLLSEFNKPFGIVTMSEEMSTAMGIEEGILQNNYSYNKLGTFDDSDDIKNRWKEIWDSLQQNKGKIECVN